MANKYKKSKKKDIGVKIIPSSPQYPHPTTGINSSDPLSNNYREYLKRIYKTASSTEPALKECNRIIKRSSEKKRRSLILIFKY